MSRSENSATPRRSRNSVPEYAGSAEVERFASSGEEVYEIVNHIRSIESDDSVEVYEWEDDWLVRYTPTRQEASASSERNNDFNVLHQYPELVADFMEEFEYADSIERDVEAVVSQGRNISDIVAAMYDEPIKRIEGSWEDMVLAIEQGTGELDEIVISPTQDAEYDVEAIKFPASNRDDVEIAGKFNVDFFQDYSGDCDVEGHNALVTAMGDLMVGRGHSTPPNIRNTELLQSTQTEVTQLLETEDIEAFNFTLDSESENSREDRFEAEIRYGDGSTAEVDLAEEAYPADEAFQNLRPVQEYAESGEILNPAAATLMMCNKALETGIEIHPMLKGP